VVTSGSEIAAKSIHLLLATAEEMTSIQHHALPAHWHCVAIGWGRRGRSWGQHNGSWLAGYFSDYRVTTKLRKSYDVVKSASKIWIQHFYDNLTTS